MAGEGGERGVTCGEPLLEYLATRITPLLVSLIRAFYFNLTSFR